MGPCLGHWRWFLHDTGDASCYGHRWLLLWTQEMVLEEMSLAINSNSGGGSCMITGSDSCMDTGGNPRMANLLGYYLAGATFVI